MKARCYRPTKKHFAKYGGRGVTVCDRWRDSFEMFLADMGQRPSAKHSLDRKDVNGNYEPSNCRWATKIEQANNTSRNKFIEFNGKTMTVSQWASSMGCAEQTLANRLKSGWPIEDALTRPVNRKFKLKFSS
jgi:hypothetical protein